MMNTTTRRVSTGLIAAALLLGVAAYTRAQEEDYGGVAGPTRADLGRWAALDVPAGYTFYNRAETQRLMEMMGNLLSQTEQGMIARDDADWFIVFEFDEIGYVNDDEKDELDADAIYKSLEEGQLAANEELKKRGQSPMIPDGWAVRPNYNEQTHNVEWCVRFTVDGEPVLNHNIRVLGRRGVMRVTLVTDPAGFDAALADTRALLTGFDYKPGQTYAEYKQGDKIAEYGLTALIAGGAAAVLVKSGLLQKLIKPLIVGGVVVAGFFARIWRRIAGRGDASAA